MSEDALSAALGAIYDTVLDDALWPAALEKAAGYVGGSSALLFHQDRAMRTGDTLHAWNADPAYTRLYFEKYVGLNPVMPFTVMMDAGSVSAFSRLIDMQEFKASKFYLEWAKPQQFLDVVVAVLDKSASAMGMFGVTRLDHEGLHDEASIARMERIAPHVRRAVAIGRMFASLETRVGVFSTTVEALGDAVYVLDASGRVLFANPAAKRLSGGQADLPVIAGILSPAEPESARALREALRLAARGEASAAAFARELVLGKSGAGRLQGHLLPLRGGNRRANGFSDAAAALFVRPVGPQSKAPMEALATLYGLTPRELQVFIGIVQFGGVPEVAEMFGMAPTTVRTHLQSLFDKTGTRRQADLAAIAASLMPPPVAPPA